MFRICVSKIHEMYFSIIFLFYDDIDYEMLSCFKILLDLYVSVVFVNFVMVEGSMIFKIFHLQHT